MAITLTVDERKEIAQQTKQNPRVIMSFYESYGLYKAQQKDDVTACQLAMRSQKEVYLRIYQQNLANYLSKLQRNYLTRLLNMKKRASGQIFMTKSGIRVRSKIEKIIADFLFVQRIRFVYEPIVNLGGFYLMPDFHLSDFEVFIEHFGRTDKQYRNSMEAKLRRYERFKIPVVATYPSDEPDIEEILIQKLRTVGVHFQTTFLIANGSKGWAADGRTVIMKP